MKTRHNEHDDDIPVGRILSRKEMLGLLMGASAVLLAGCDALPTALSQISNSSSSSSASQTNASSTSATSSTSQLACIVTPELTEGPYFVDEKLNRADIRSDPNTGAVKEGALLRLTINVSEVVSGSCSPYAGAYVDVWHCDALGTYSDVVDNAQGFNTKGQQFLRGYQVTDTNGKVEFTTIYPGWYEGRAVHIHFKIRNALNATQAHTFTSQLFFDDSITDTVQAQSPYSSKGQRTMRNSADNIYQQGGSQMLLKPVKEGDAYIASIAIGVNKV
jgi:protocatechuate 3,4-dioxygenase beta subunit